MTDRPALPKSADAYRTISEVAAELNIPQHVLRFWETRFPQVKPLKRAGGRRFYRPDDVALLRAVQFLLYGEGYTIKGVQRLLAEHGARHVADALARSRAAPASAGPDPLEGEARDGSDDPGPEPDRPVRREPAPPHTVPPRTVPTRTTPTQTAPAQIAPAQPVLPRPLQPRHASQQQLSQQPPPRSGPPDVGAPAGGTVIDRLAEVLADLDQSSRLLSSLRSTGNCQS